jgi:hypothetical protein
VPTAVAHALAAGGSVERLFEPGLQGPLHSGLDGVRRLMSQLEWARRPQGGSTFRASWHPTSKESQ